jgi:hypothetical protein
VKHIIYQRASETVEAKYTFRNPTCVNSSGENPRNNKAVLAQEYHTE